MHIPNSLVPGFSQVRIDMDTADFAQKFELGYVQLKSHDVMAINGLLTTIQNLQQGPSQEVYNIGDFKS